MKIKTKLNKKMENDWKLKWKKSKTKTKNKKSANWNMTV